MSGNSKGGYPQDRRKCGIGFAEYSPRVSALEAVHKCLNRGLSAVQISGDFPINFPENIVSADRKTIRNLIEAEKINLHLHAPSDIPLAGRHDQIRLGGLQRLAEFIEMAVEMGAKSFVFHPGRFAYYRIGSGRIVMAEKKVNEARH